MVWVSCVDLVECDEFDVGVKKKGTLRSVYKGVCLLIEGAFSLTTYVTPPLLVAPPWKECRNCDAFRALMTSLRHTSARG